MGLLLAREESKGESRPTRNLTKERTPIFCLPQNPCRHSKNELNSVGANQTGKGLEGLEGPVHRQGIKSLRLGIIPSQPRDASFHSQRSNLLFSRSLHNEKANGIGTYIQGGIARIRHGEPARVRANNTRNNGEMSALPPRRRNCGAFHGAKNQEGKTAFFRDR